MGDAILPQLLRFRYRHDGVRAAVGDQDSRLILSRQIVSLGPAGADLTDGSDFAAPQGKCNPDVSSQRISKNKNGPSFHPRSCFPIVKQSRRRRQELREPSDDFLTRRKTLPSNGFEVVRQHDKEAVARQLLFAKIVGCGLFYRAPGKRPGRANQHKNERKRAGPVRAINLYRNMISIHRNIPQAVGVTADTRSRYGGSINRGEHKKQQQTTRELEECQP